MPPRVRPSDLAVAVLASIALLALGPPARAQDADPPAWRDAVPPPRDVTLATRADPARRKRLEAPGSVLFADDFEPGRAGGDDLAARYFEVRGLREGLVRVEAVTASPAHPGAHALRCVAPARDGRESGAGASGWLGADGHPRVHFRRYVRFAEDYDQGDLNHTGGGLAGLAGRGRWDEMGKAGVRPRGDDRFTVGFEPWRDWGRVAAPGYLFLYTYWVDMQRGGDGRFWGNMLQPPPERRVVPRRGEWICLEQMIQVNTVSEDGALADGELAAWVDGELYLHYEGLRWRTDARVLVKRFDLGVYVHRARRENVVWYDDVVVSTGYVGPLRAAPPGGGEGGVRPAGDGDAGGL